MFETVKVGTADEACVILRKRLVDLDDGTRLQPRTLTVRDYFGGIADHPDPLYQSGWLKRHARKVSPRTMERYVEKVRSHIIPHLGIRRMQELRAAHLDNFYADLLDHGRLDGRGGLAARTVKHIDLDAAVLTVAGAIEETRAGLRFKEPKSKSGRRSIARIAKRAGVNITSHKLLHWHNSDLLRRGVHMKVAQERAGHSSISITKDTCSHITGGSRHAAAERLDGGLRDLIDGAR